VWYDGASGVGSTVEDQEGDLTIKAVTDINLVPNYSGGKVTIGPTSGPSGDAYMYFDPANLMTGGSHNGYEWNWTGGNVLSATPGAIIRLGGSARGDNDINSIIFKQNSTEIGRFNRYADFAVDTNSLFVDASANAVGIGNTAPGKTLDITGTLRASSTMTLSSITSCTGGNALQTNGSGDVACGAVSGGGGGLTGSGAANQMTYWTGTSSVGGDTNFILDTTNDWLALGTTAAKSRLTLGNTLASGVLDNYNEYSVLLYDVGTASTSYGLGVSDQTLRLQGGGTTIAFDQGGTQNMTLLSGYLGLETTSPAYKLDVYEADATGSATIAAHAANDAIDPALLLYGQSTGEGMYIFYDNSVGDTYFRNIYGSSTDAMHFQTANGATELVTMKNNGYIGFLDTTPLARMSIGNNVATGVLDAYSEFQMMLYDSGAASTSYGLGVASNTLVMQSGGTTMHFDLGAVNKMSLDTGGLNIVDGLTLDFATSCGVLGTNVSGDVSCSSTSISGSGAANQMTYWTGTNTIAGDTNHVWDATNDWLAVGASSAKSRLTLGNTLASGVLNTYGEYSILLYDDGTASNSYGLGVSNSTLRIQSGGTTTAFDQAGVQKMSLVSGNLGINTAAPSSYLTVGNNIGTGAMDTFGEYQLLLYDSGVPSTSYGLGIRSGTLIMQAGGQIDWDIANVNKMSLSSSGLTVVDDLTVDTNTLYVDSANNGVGINTTSPAAQAHAHNPTVGHVNSGVLITTSETGSTSSDGLFLWYDGAGSNGSTIEDQEGDLTLKSVTDINLTPGTGGTVATGDLTVDTNTLYVDSANGQVGMGTTSPTTNYKLDVVTATAADAGVRIYNANSGSGASTELRLKAGAVAERESFFRMNPGVGPLSLGGGLDTLIVNEYKTSAIGDIHFGTQGVIDMTLESGGELGIGTQTPSALLDVDAGTGRGIIEIDGSTGGCLKIRDIDGTNWTYCKASGGSLTCSASAC